MTVPFLHAGSDPSFVGMRSFLSHLLDVKKQEPFVSVTVHRAVFIPSVVLGIGGSCFHFAAPIVYRILSAEPRLCLITRKAQTSESKVIISTQQSILVIVVAMLGLQSAFVGRFSACPLRELALEIRLN